MTPTHARGVLHQALERIADPRTDVAMVLDGFTTEFWVTIAGEDFYLTMRRAATRPPTRILKRGRR